MTKIAPGKDPPAAGGLLSAVLLKTLALCHMMRAANNLIEQGVFVIDRRRRVLVGEKRQMLIDCTWYSLPYPGVLI